MPRQVFTAGEILTAAEMNDLADATVMVFDDSAARGSAIPTPSEGMVTYLKDTNQVQAYDGSAFAPLGTILQVVSTAKTDTFSTTSTSFVDVTGLTATITPSSATSKILIMTHVPIGHTATGTNQGGQIRLNGGNASDYVGDASSNRVRAAGWTGSNQNDANIANSAFAQSIVFLDSPATTSAVPYAVQARTGVSGQTLYVGRSGTDTDNASFARLPSSITLMEVAG